MLCQAREMNSHVQQLQIATWKVGAKGLVGHLPIQIPRCDTHFVQFKEDKLIQLRHFFFWRETEISFITKILTADGLRSHVTITLRDKSRYDLILKINETA